MRPEDRWSGLAQCRQDDPVCDHQVWDPCGADMRLSQRRCVSPSTPPRRWPRAAGPLGRGRGGPKTRRPGRSEGGETGAAAIPPGAA